MAAQLRPVVPSSSPFARLPPSGFSSSRTQSFIFNRGDSGFSFSSHGSTGKRPHSLSAFSSSSSTINTERYGTSELSEVGGDGGGSFNGHGGEGGGGGGRDDNHADNEGNSGDNGGLFGALLKGWNERVNADPQFPFKVLMEQIVGVGASVIGDMSCRPNFGLNELDFVFSTLVVGSILNFSLMYMLAPTSVAAATASTLPFIFSSCPPGHMFEQGAYSVLDRLGTFVYKGAVFAAVGFGAGLFGTFLSNCLIGLRQNMDPNFESQNKAPPTLLNASTWAIHMGLSSNLRYQVINGMEFAMENVLAPPIFKGSVLCLRAFNNVLGGFSFVTLARLTGSQKKAEAREAPSLDLKRLEASANEAEEPKLSNTECRSSEKIATTEGSSTNIGKDSTNTEPISIATTEASSTNIGEDSTKVKHATPKKEIDASS